MHVGPFDEVVRLPDDFSRRIARNVHFILSEECDLTKVIDPAGGSYAVEKLTDQIAAESWKLFQAIEAKGGLIAALAASAAGGDAALAVRRSLAKLFLFIGSSSFLS